MVTDIVERSSLSFPSFRTLWIANSASNLGAMIQLVSASWLMTALAAPPGMVTLVQASLSLPFVLIALPAGAFADNRDRRMLMITAQSILLVVSSALALSTRFNWTTPWILLGFTFLLGCGTALNGPAWQASIGDLVPRSLIPNAVALNAVSANVARSLGPALGGAIIAAAGSAVAFFSSVLSTVGLLYALVRWRPVRHQQPLPPEKLGDAVAAGLRYAIMSPNIRVALIRTVLAGFSMCQLPALLPLVVRDILRGGPMTYGLLLGSFGFGAVFAASLIRHAQRALRPELIMQLSLVLTAVGASAAATCHNIWVLSFLVSLAGAGWVFAFSTLNVSIQLASPRWVSARMLAAYQVSLYAGTAAGSWMCGAAASQTNVVTALGLCALLNLSLSMLRRYLPLKDFSEQDLEPSSAWQAPPTAIEVQMRSGPIVISTEHRIKETNTVRFLTVMQERRLIRRRDGALNWTLARDLSDPELWVESYRVPTWLDYVRLQSRRTNADEDNLAALRALWARQSDPVVRRMIERPVSGSLSFKEGNCANYWAREL